MRMLPRFAQFLSTLVILIAFPWQLRAQSVLIDDFEDQVTDWTASGGGIAILDPNTVEAIDGDADLAFDFPAISAGTWWGGRIQAELGADAGPNTHISLKAEQDPVYSYRVDVEIYDDDNADGVYQSDQDDRWTNVGVGTPASLRVPAGSGIFEIHLSLADGNWEDQNPGQGDDLLNPGLVRLALQFVVLGDGSSEGFSRQLDTIAFTDGTFDDFETDTLNAGALVFRSIGQAHATSGWELGENGYIGSFIRTAQASDVTVVVRAEGDSDDSVLPSMEFHVADSSTSWQVTDNGDANDTFSEYSDTYTLPPGTHAFRIELNNAGPVGSGERSLFVKDIGFFGEGVTVSNAATRENVLNAAETYIENYRRGPETLVLRNSATNDPIPAGTPVTLTLQRHAFLWGAAVYGTSLSNSDWLNTSFGPSTDQAKYRQFIIDHFNAIVPENAGKWVQQERTRDAENLDAHDAMMDFAEEHNLYARMHTFIWPRRTSLPDPWCRNLFDSAVAGDTSAQAELLEETYERLEYYVRDRGHRYYELDCINEGMHVTEYLDMYGYSGIAQIYADAVAALQDAASANGTPVARNAINDYQVIHHWAEPPRDPSGNDDLYANWYKNHILRILEEGGVIDAIGIQGHTRESYHDPVFIHRTLQNLEWFEKPLTMTEFSLRMTTSEEKRPVITEEMMKLFYGTPHGDGFMFWGFWKPRFAGSGDEDPGSDLSGSALVDTDWTLTPTGQAYLRLMDEWRTVVETTVGGNGEVLFEGSYGDYKVAVPGAEAVFSHEKGRDSQTVLLSFPSSLDSWMLH